MKYLDYLETHAWEELPTAVRQEISRADYTERRDLALAMVEQTNAGLPPALVTALAARTQDAVRKPKRKVRPLWLLTAAGWLLFAVAATLLLLRSPNKQTVYRVIASDLPEPTVITRTDTLYQTKMETVLRYQTIHDTVYLPEPVVEFVAVTDTLYVPMPIAEDPGLKVTGSRSLAGRQNVTRFLFATE